MTRRIFALWHGGTSYAPGSIEDDLEVFDGEGHATETGNLWQAIDDAVTECGNRYQCGGYFRCDVRPVEGDPYTTYFPTVGDDSEMHVWLTDPRGSDDPYPDYIISLDTYVGEFVIRRA